MFYSIRIINISDTDQNFVLNSIQVINISDIDHKFVFHSIRFINITDTSQICVTFNSSY